MLKRIISLVLVFVMLPAMLPALQGNDAEASMINALRLRNAAFAESLGEFGEDYDDIPESEWLTQGDWTYAVLPDGYAVILAYGGTVSNLTVPESLGGHWVTAIARGAFTHPLSSIRIHGNITSIAGDAFACEKNFTVRAYNGTHALSYAKAQGMEYSNLSTLEFVDGVIDFTEINRSHYSFISSSQILINQLEGRRVQVGTMFYLPPDSVNELGEAYEVLSVSNTGGGILLTVTEADPAAVLEQILLEDVKLIPDMDNIVILMDGVSVDQDAIQAQRSERLGAGGSISGNIPLVVNIEHGDWTFSGGVNIKTTASVDADIRLLPFKIRSYTVKQVSTTTFNVKATYGVEDTKPQQKVDKKITDKTFTLAKVPFVSNGAVTGNFVVKMELSIDGEFEFSYEVETETGQAYYDGVKRPINKRTTKKINLSGGVNAKYLIVGGLTISVPVVEDIAVLTAGVGPSFDAKVTGYVDITEDADFGACIDVSIDLVLEVAVKVGYLKEKEKKYYIGGTVIDGKWHLFNFHIENWKIVETCTKGKKVVHFYSSPGSAVPSQSVAAGETASKPANPKRPGYEFTGWYTSKDLSTLWDFTQPVKDNMILYAGWNLVDPDAIDPEVEASGGSTYVPLGDAAYLKYKVSGGKATITGYYGNPTRLNIPETLGGATVTAIASKAFQNCTTLTEITFPDTLETIGTYAFDGCTGLDGTITFPADIHLDERSFQYCSGIDDLEFLGRVEFELGAFRYCTGLTCLTLPDSYYIRYSTTASSYNIFYGCTNLKKLIWDGFSTINDVEVSANTTTSAFSELKNVLEEVEYRQGSYVVGEQFKNFTKLKKVTFADELQVVGKYAFYGCTALETELDLSQVQYIGAYAFYNCKKATNLKLGSGLTNIGNYAFYNCDGIAGTVEIKGADLKVGEYVFNECSGITKAVFSADTTQIHVGAFKNCTALEEVVMNSGVNSYYRYNDLSYTNNNVFSGCTRLKKLTFGSAKASTGYVAQEMLYELRNIVEEITLNEGAYGLREKAFANFTKLREVHFPSTFRQIDANAFSGCTALERVDLILADDVTVAGGAFSGCTALKDVRFGKGVVSVAADAFDAGSTFNAMCYYGTPASDCLNELEYAAVSYFRDDYLLTFDYQDGYSFSTMYSAGSVLPQLADYKRSGWELTGWHMDAEGASLPVDLTTMVMPAANLTLYAQWTRTATDFVYVVENGKAVITEYVGEDGELIIPSSLGGYTVSGIAAEAIGSGVHYLTIPATVTEIDPRAFVHASSLTGFAVSADSTAFMAENGVLFSGNGKKLLHFAAKNAVNVYTVPDQVTEIRDWAFAGASKLTEVVLNDRITVLRSNVFHNCTKLEKVELSDALTSIRSNAFGNCSKLLTLTLPDTIASISEGAFTGCPLEMVIYFTPGHEVLTAYADKYMIDYNLYELNWYVDGELIYSVDQRAGERIEMLPIEKPEYASWGGWTVNDSDTLWNFETDLMPAGTLNLHAVRVEDFVYEISGGKANILQYVGTETEVLCPNELGGCPVAQISDAAFAGMNDVTIIADAGSVWQTFAEAHGYKFTAVTVTVTFNTNGGASCAPVVVNRLSVIGEPSTVRTGWTFTGWYTDSALTTLWNFDTAVTADMTLYAGWESDGETVDHCLTYEDDGKGVTITGYSGIKGTVTIPETLNGLPVTAIADYAFYGSSSIVTVELPETVVEIGESAFAASTLTEITIPDSVKMIGEGAFADCSRLTAAALGTGCTALPAYLFDGCTALLELSVPEGVKSIGRNFVANAGNLLAIELPDSLTGIGEYAFAHCTLLTGISFGPKVSYIPVNLFNGCSSLDALNVDSGNMYYASVNGVLYDKSKSTLVCYPKGRTGEAVIPTGVMIIGENSFSDAGVSRVVIPASVLRISDNAFNGCSGLAQVQFKSGSSAAYIGESAFAACGSLNEFVIPDGVSELGDEAFAYCAELTALTVPESVDTIGKDIVPVSTSLIIYGKKGSAIEGYAAENGLRFIDPASMTAVESIAFALDEIILEPGASTQLKVLFTPANATETGIDWFSSDASVVYIDENGVASARRSGSAVITATAANGETAAVTIHVEEKSVDVTGIVLNSAAMVTLNQYEVVQILAQVLPVNANNRQLNYSSSNNAVASVGQDGLVTALKPGTAVITASAAEDDSFSVKVTVTVKPIVFKAELEDEVTVIAKNGSAVIKPVIFPKRHEIECTWSISDSSVATIDRNGKVTAVGTGPAAVSVQITDGITTVQLTQMIYIEGAVGLTLPAALTTIEEEAFLNTKANDIVIGESVVEIGPRAFADHPAPIAVHMPDSVGQIADNAFEGCGYVALFGSEGSCAQEFAAAHGYFFAVE